jgi:hypothetical protein
MSALFSKPREASQNKRRRRRASLAPVVEGLDVRALPSAGLNFAMAAHAAEVRHVRDSEHDGTVVKTPRFYEDYVGPRLAQLNVVSATGLLRNGNFSFAGVVQGKINPSVRATYVFGVDRGGSLPVGPFPDRPNIRFDATIAIRIVPGQSPTVVLTDIAHKTTTTVQDPSLDISGKKLSVVIPGSLLPSTGLAPSHYRFNLWPVHGLSGSTNIASFAPEFHDIRVGVAHRA